MERMYASILIIAFSAVMLVYWFHYTCLLSLAARKTSRFAALVAESNGLAFPKVQNQLSHSGQLALGALQKSLDRDFRVICFLTKSASAIGTQSIEEKLLVMDYRMMRLWYAFARLVVPVQARSAVSEMSNIVAYLADVMGERADAIAEI